MRGAPASCAIPNPRSRGCHTRRVVIPSGVLAAATSSIRAVPGSIGAAPLAGGRPVRAAGSEERFPATFAYPSAPSVATQAASVSPAGWHVTPGSAGCCWRARQDSNLRPEESFAHVRPSRLPSAETGPLQEQQAHIVRPHRGASGRLGSGWEYKWSTNGGPASAHANRPVLSANEVVDGGELGPLSCAEDFVLPTAHPRGRHGS